MNIVHTQQLDHIDQFLMSFTSQNTRIAYEKDLKDYVAFASGSDLVSFSTLVLYRNHLISKAAPATVVRKFSAVKSFMSFLASQGLIQSNPAYNLKIPKASTKEHTEAFDDAEVVKVINVADVNSFQGSTHRLALIILFNLGLRRSELVNLRVRSIGEHRGTRFLTVEGKGGKQRLIPLTDAVYSEINAYLLRYSEFTGMELIDSDFLIQSNHRDKNDKAMDPSTIYRMVKQYSREAGVTRRVSPHSCRATMISHLLEKNVSPRSVADLAGHANINTTVNIYDRKRDSLTNRTAFKVNYES